MLIIYKICTFIKKKIYFYKDSRNCEDLYFAYKNGHMKKEILLKINRRHAHLYL